METDERVSKVRVARSPHYITMRLSDALPRSVMQAWHDDIDRRIAMLREAKGRELAEQEERELVHRAIGKIERQLDTGFGSCLLVDDRAAAAVEAVIWQMDGIKYQLHAWSVMPNHLHALLTPLNLVTIDEIVTEWKAESTRRVNQELRRSGGVWHPNVIDFEVEGPSAFTRFRQTICQNPSSVGLSDWPFAGEEGRLHSTTLSA
jgi:REP element-mobilizing transposase RayT